MSPIPQRRKTAQELAELRDSLGIPAAAPKPFTGHEYQPPDLPRGGIPAPPVRPAPEKSASLPALPAAGNARISPSVSKPAAISQPVVVPTHAVPQLETPAAFAPRPTKQVRSLKRSERLPVTLISPADTGVSGSSDLPAHRHSEAQLNEIRRQAAIGNLGNAPPPDFRFAPSNPLWIITGYMLALAAALICTRPVFHSLFPAATRLHPLATAGVLDALALAVAAGIFLRRFYSRHHAAIILIIVAFTLVFASIHYIPILRHGS